MKKSLPIALVLLLVAAALVELGTTRPEPIRRAENAPAKATSPLPETSQAPSTVTASIARTSADTTTTTTTTKVNAETTASAQQIAAENELLASYGTEGTSPTKLADFGWYASQSWTVEVWSYRMADGDRGAWSDAPTMWRLQVRGRETLDGRDVWALDVQPVDLTGLPFNPGGTVYVAVDDHSLVALRDRVQENGEVHERFLKLDDGEGSALSSLLPVELPPAGIEGRERKTTLGVLRPSALRPDPKLVAPRSSGTVVDLEFEADGSTVRQRWDAESPWWPLYSRTPSRVCVLRNK